MAAERLPNQEQAEEQPQKPTSGCGELAYHLGTLLRLGTRSVNPFDNVAKVAGKAFWKGDTPYIVNSILDRPDDYYDR